MVIAGILRHWSDVEVRSSKAISTEHKILSLRTILASIDTWSSGGPMSRKYLEYIADFLSQAGVNVTAYDSFDDLPEEAQRG